MSTFFTPAFLLCNDHFCSQDSRNLAKWDSFYMPMAMWLRFGCLLATLVAAGRNGGNGGYRNSRPPLERPQPVGMQPQVVRLEVQVRDEMTTGGEATARGAMTGGLRIQGTMTVPQPAKIKRRRKRSAQHLLPPALPLPLLLSSRSLPKNTKRKAQAHRSMRTKSLRKSASFVII